MALELLASIVADKVLEKLASNTYQEISIAWGVHGELRKLQDVLTTIKAVLLDAEEKQVENRELRVWLAKLKDAFYDAEDLLDEFECEQQRKQVLKLYGTTAKKVGRFLSPSNPLVFRFKMGHRIKEIRERLDEIASHKAKFHLERKEAMRVIPIERAMTHSFVEASNVIGRDEDKENIIRLLQKPNDSGETDVIAIVGIGGLGKTALAKLVYNDERVQNNFEHKMWVCVSEDFDVKILTEKIIQCITNGSENIRHLEMEQLQGILRERIGYKKYLLILDDVWNDDRKRWNALNELLCTGANGSKILVTTRSNEVASIMGSVSEYELKGLPHDECMALFTKCAFKAGEEKCYPNLVKVGEEIVRKCKGVPLAVTTIASLLFTQREGRYWKSIRDNGLWQMEQKENDILPALRLSYDHLPAYLKRCFAYCCFYPKNYEYIHLVLIHFWMAHGLLESTNENEELEDIGLRYIQELRSRSFFQDFEEDSECKLFSSCKMHDLVHDLALSLTQNEFSTITTSTKDISKGVRHLLFLSIPQNLPTLLQGLDHVRTAIFNTEEMSQSALNLCLLRFQSLRVLDFRDSKFEVWLEKIGSLKHLRYLCLPEACEVEKIPNSFCKLQSLQFLWLGEEIEDLPSNIRYLINLRFLIFPRKQKRLSKNGLGCLTSLRFFWILRNEHLEYLCEDMQGLKHLRTLFIFECYSLISLPQSIKYLTALETLHIEDCTNLNLTWEVDDQDLAQFSLQKLILVWLPKLVALPEWLLARSTNSLQLLKLGSCRNLKKLPACLHNMTSLQQLVINDCAEVRNRCEREVGEDWSKIAHIPKIVINEGCF
ncbi:putative disease resistance protein RGA1 [Manihot esculenta]|uniref:Uncharacterized protein n=2 Tax=Manihot esculenta TaxID=3983 RepID=A0ACB7H3T0_MANES|nr:putative disease resistance protein RGA1 [Manihot esculenta]XP_043816166.1 putative disease resistance protein RGA1 [Manihot esculenta]XP_043816167.1 putative disease resistance protein RGA1 [Manihot esculenta]XP_043816168.1 putative disease resistance protein RGA1 [Manihot esculenta]XP_043816169.1 putative disease resistance protein RGA1 [Manihot esculenta]XP_043816170.1 putative disease resistance protein RGA1 [Manihot esculenta]XP_043816171.1 putative disease resistance protein RGA1 [Ma